MAFLTQLWWLARGAFWLGVCALWLWLLGLTFYVIAGTGTGLVTLGAFLRSPLEADDVGEAGTILGSIGVSVLYAGVWPVVVAVAVWWRLLQLQQVEE